MEANTELTRRELELKALMTCSADITYDLRNCIDEVSDEELIAIIECDGDNAKEEELFNQNQ